MFEGQAIHADFAEPAERNDPEHAGSRRVEARIRRTVGAQNVPRRRPEHSAKTLRSRRAPGSAGFSRGRSGGGTVDKLGANCG
ncbi:Hypothetical protein A7982_08391 [Minicystis rosea]|nr:Hypothetical protein A7982_08391 [Minicystis rosea]